MRHKIVQARELDARELDVDKIASELSKRHFEPYTQKTGFPAKFMHYARAIRDAYQQGKLFKERRRITKGVPS